MTISVLFIFWPAKNVTNDARVKLPISFVINEISKKTMLEFDRKKSCMQEHLYKHFQTEGHKCFLNEASVTFIDRADGKGPKKREWYWMWTLKTMKHYGQLHLLIKQMEKVRKRQNNSGCEHWKQWNIMILILQLVYRRLILYFACLLAIILGPALFL